MEVFTVNNFNELYGVLNKYCHDHRWKFRGQCNEEWGLVPAVGRSPVLVSSEKPMFYGWKRRAIAHLHVPSDDNWAWLTIAQHHGLRTRMLDWSHHVLTAVFFAVTEKEDTVTEKEDADAKKVVDAALYAYRPDKELNPENMKDPLDFEGIAFYDPMSYIPRIGTQAALFTVHGPPDLSLNEYLDKKGKSDHLHKIIIKKEYREELVFALSQLGVNWATLFPDLEGLSRHFNWVGKNRKRLEPAEPEDTI